MINICIFNGDMSRGGGTERITQILANCLSKNNKYNITVLNLNNDSGESYYPLNSNVNFDILKKKGIFNKIIELGIYLKKNKINVLIDVDIMLGIFSIPATIFNRKTKIISWEMFNINNDIGSKNTHKIRKLCLRKSAYYVNQTKGDMEAFKERMAVKCPICYIYNPCVINSSNSNYDTNSKIILSAGHFFYDKGFDLAVEVGKRVFEKHKDWKWEIYGDGPEFENIKNKIIEYGLENNIILCGRTKKLDEIYKKSSMYVMTSRTEGFGLVLTEAKLNNLPTLSFDIDFGPREIIEDGISGYLIPLFDVSEMANKIIELIENNEKRISFSSHAKDNCDKFSISNFTNNWINIIEKVIEKR